MNRADLMKAMAAHKAAYAACEKALKAWPEQMFNEQGTAVTERVPGVGVLSSSLSHSTAMVTDDALFLDWVQTQYPTEVKTETVTVRTIRNPAWRDQLLAGLLPVDPDYVEPGEATSCMDDEGQIIPGVVWYRGGRFLHASVTLDAALKREYAAAAKAYVERGVPMAAIDLPRVAVSAGQTDGPVAPGVLPGPAQDQR